jgi:hypothetical protein
MPRDASAKNFGLISEKERPDFRRPRRGFPIMRAVGSVVVAGG